MHSVCMHSVCMHSVCMHSVCMHSVCMHPSAAMSDASRPLGFYPPQSHSLNYEPLSHFRSMEGVIQNAVFLLIHAYDASLRLDIRQRARVTDSACTIMEPLQWEEGCDTSIVSDATQRSTYVCEGGDCRVNSYRRRLIMDPSGEWEHLSYLQSYVWTKPVIPVVFQGKAAVAASTMGQSEGGVHYEAFSISRRDDSERMLMQADGASFRAPCEGVAYIESEESKRLARHFRQLECVWLLEKRGVLQRIEESRGRRGMMGIESSQSVCIGAHPEVAAAIRLSRKDRIHTAVRQPLSMEMKQRVSERYAAKWKRLLGSLFLLKDFVSICSIRIVPPSLDLGILGPVWFVESSLLKYVLCCTLLPYARQYLQNQRDYSNRDQWVALGRRLRYFTVWLTSEMKMQYLGEGPNAYSETMVRTAFADTMEKVQVEGERFLKLYKDESYVSKDEEGMRLNLFMVLPEDHERHYFMMHALLNSSYKRPSPTFFKDPLALFRHLEGGYYQTIRNAPFQCETLFLPQLPKDFFLQFSYLFSPKHQRNTELANFLSIIYTMLREGAPITTINDFVRDCQSIEGEKEDEEARHYFIQTSGYALSDDTGLFDWSMSNAAIHSIDSWVLASIPASLFAFIRDCFRNAGTAIAALTDSAEQTGEVEGEEMVFSYNDASILQVDAALSLKEAKRDGSPPTDTLYPSTSSDWVHRRDASDAAIEVVAETQASKDLADGVAATDAYIDRHPSPTHRRKAHFDLTASTTGFWSRDFVAEELPLPPKRFSDFRAKLSQSEVDSYVSQMSSNDRNAQLKNQTVGRYGEEFVYFYLSEEYKWSITNKTSQVVWLNQNSESGECYDILLKIKNPEMQWELYYIEVKSSTSQDKSVFAISHSEWRMAQLKGDNYQIYRLLGVGTSNLKLLRIQNPYRQWKDNRIGLSIVI